MPKDNKCSVKPSSSSSSESSERCHKVKCEPKCEQDCCIKECKCYSPEELVCLYKDAVVEIQSEFILLGASGPSAPSGTTPLGVNSRADVFLEGNGFFIKGHYIIAPASLVLLPPSVTSTATRYPLFDSSNTGVTGQMKNATIRASRILVSVFNVNGGGHSFVYEADLVGVDGAGDIAVLRINYKKQWNLCNPCVEKCHPFLTFGSSRASHDGEKVYLIGDYVSEFNRPGRFNAVGAVTEGLLSDHRHVDYSGWVLAETVLVSANVYAFSSGLPILNCQGQVIGMQTTAVVGSVPLPGVLFPHLPLGFGSVQGPSEFFMRRVIKTIIKGTCSRKFNCQLETICDTIGSFYRYRHAYLGLAYDVFTGSDYDTTTDYTSGLLPLGQPRVRLSNTGEFLSSPSCKELVGIRVLGLAGFNPNDLPGVVNGYHYVPGGVAAAPLLTGLPVSPLLGLLRPGDVITHMECVGLGDLYKQIAPSLITWRLCAGDQLEITYRRGGNALNTADNGVTENYDNLFTQTVCLAEYPPGLDYPWYAVSSFPNLSDLPYSFVFPATQQTLPLYPVLGEGGEGEAGVPGAGKFHPSI